jgi:mono/diheme cytochrome c family protein
MKNLSRSILQFVVGFALFNVCGFALAQPERCDPTKTLSAEQCAKCHGNEVRVWQQTPHFTTYQELSRRPRSKEIVAKMGLRGTVKRNDVCMGCHFTVQQKGDKLKAIAGVSCESCHGSSRDWLNVHNDYGGPTATRETESEAHRQKRLQTSSDLGMRNTQNLYLIASSCLNCHTVPNEELVNVGGHLAGTDDFELVAYSQGRVRHNFLRTGNVNNAESSQSRLRVMFVVGLIADLEYSTRATSLATHKSTYGLKVANRAAQKAVKLYELQQKLNDPDLQALLEAFSTVSLRVNNREQLNEVADVIKNHGQRFASRHDGSNLAAIDSALPDPSTYR